jgi:sugar phosphate isomerase/epimerase
MVEELLRMGVGQIELGHGLAVTQLEGIFRVVERGDVRVSSVHNFCPHPIDVGGDSPDCYEFTSHRERDRQRALRLTRASLETAGRVGARRVVVHGGRVRTQRPYREALELVEEGKYLGPEWAEFKVRVTRERERASELYLGRLEAALRTLLPVAEAAGIVLGLENRERYEDVPSEREMEPFLQRLDSVAVGYWHDFGHARIKENLGFLDHASLLEKMAPRLVGCHVHDVNWVNDDHQPPGMGEIDFDRLVPILPKETLYVFELSPHCPAEVVRQAWSRWQERYPETL